jgi:DNA-binding transcriptional MocR family regulator
MDTILRRAMETGEGPKYQRLVEGVEAAVADGRLSAGDKLPPVRELAWQLEITPGTVARAFTLLAQKGVVESAVGRGTFVAAPPIPLFEDVWSREAQPLSQRPHVREVQGGEDGALRLLAPRLPDVGQVEALRVAMTRAAQLPVEQLLNYPNRTTQKGLQEAALDWLSGLSLGPMDADDIVLTFGGQNAIELILQTILVGPDPVILVEELSYAGFRRAAEGLRARVVPVPMDGDGAVPEALEAIARQTGAQVFGTMPEVHNPTCITTPDPRRAAIADVARRVGFQVIEDDCYRMGRSSGRSYRMLLPEQSWHISSLSKSFTPALRVGFATAPHGMAGGLRRTTEFSYFGMPQLLVETARQFLTDPRLAGFESAVRKRLSEYLHAAVNVLGRFDISWQEDVPFLFLNLPRGWRPSAYCQAAEARGVQVRSADEFALRDGHAPSAVRIAINAQVPLERFSRAMDVLATLLDDPPEQISV